MFWRARSTGYFREANRIFMKVYVLGCDDVRLIGKLCFSCDVEFG